MPFSVGITLLFVALASVGGGLIQGTTGFGYGIFVMIFFPALLPLLGAVGCSSMISLGGLLILTLRYRKSIRWKYIPAPLAIYYVVSAFCIHLSTKLNTEALKGWLGLLLLVLALYFAFFSGKIKIKINALSTLIAATLSGFLSGFFAIGGPPMVIYYLSATKTKEEYLGSCQCFFLLTGLYTTVIRILNGIITADLLKFVAVGYVGMGVGLLVASAIIKRIDTETMKKAIYAVIGCSGLWLFISNFPF